MFYLNWTNPPLPPPRLPRQTSHHHVLPKPRPGDGLLQEDGLRSSGGKLLQEMFHSGSPQWGRIRRRRWRRRGRLPRPRASREELLWDCGLRQRHWGCPVASSLPSERSAAVNNSVQEQLTAQNIQQRGFAAAPGAQHGDRPAVRHHVRPGGQTLRRVSVGQTQHPGGQVALLLLHNIPGLVLVLCISIFILFSSKVFVKKIFKSLKTLFPSNSIFEEAGRLFYWDPRRPK